MKTLYKVLNKDKTSPSQGFKYHLGKTYHCPQFDESPIECSSGFYATDIDGLPYTYNIHKSVYRCNVWGKEKEIDQFKRRYEYIKLLDKVSKKELISLAKGFEKKAGYKLSEVINPHNPLNKIAKPTKKDIELLRKWDSVGASVGASVWDSVRDSVRDSVWASVRDSVGASVWGYVGSFFPNIKKWKYIKHKKGQYPYQCCIDLWKQGLVPSFDGKVWRLHGGINADVLYEMKVSKC